VELAIGSFLSLTLTPTNDSRRFFMCNNYCIDQCIWLVDWNQIRYCGSFFFIFQPWTTLIAFIRPWATLIAFIRSWTTLIAFREHSLSIGVWMQRPRITCSVSALIFPVLCLRGLPGLLTETQATRTLLAVSGFQLRIMSCAKIMIDNLPVLYSSSKNESLYRPSWSSHWCGLVLAGRGLELE
jgi:hypothetical protein